MNEIQLTAALRACLDAPPDTRFYRRAVALLALDAGQSVAEVADLLGVTRQSIYNWARAYQASPRPETLRDRPGGGRPTLWTAQRRATLEHALRHRPDALGSIGANWTVPLLRQYLRQYLHDRTGEWLSADTLRRELDRLEYTGKRFRYVLPPDPAREKKTRPPAVCPGLAGPNRGPGRG